MYCNGDNVTQFLVAGKDATRVALDLLEDQYTYGALRSAADHVAWRLSRLRTCKGDRVILVSENSFFWVAAYLGILRAGLVCVPLPTNVSLDYLSFILENTEARVAFVQTEFATRLGSRLRLSHLVTDRSSPVLSGVGSQSSFSDLRDDGLASGFIPPDTDRNDLAALMFTSGSTGSPRGVMVSHGNIIANTESIIQYTGLTKDDRMMTVLPFHYCFGTSLLHTHLRVGGCLVIDSRFMYPEKILQRMIDTGCTGFAGVPTHFQILVRRSSIRQKHFPQLRHVQQAGGYLAPSLIRELGQVLPNTQIFAMYGQTEATARLSYLPPELLEAKAGSVGKGILGVKLRVLTERGVPTQPGEIGQIVAEGPNITLGYWRAPAESATTFRDGVLYTGDLATVDEDGFIYIVGRMTDFLKCGGKRVSCRNLEEILVQSDDVLEAAVIAMPDDVLGEAVKAFIVPRDIDSEAGLKERLHRFCQLHMYPECVPREILLLSALPKSSAGKVLKTELQLGHQWLTNESQPVVDSVVAFDPATKAEDATRCDATAESNQGTWS